MSRSIVPGPARPIVRLVNDAALDLQPPWAKEFLHIPRRRGVEKVLRRNAARMMIGGAERLIGRAPELVRSDARVARDADLQEAANLERSA